jgi:hypothetical protein
VFGAVVGVAGLLAVVVYISGIDHVVSTPSAYGWGFDASAGGGNDPSAIPPLRDYMLRQRSIADVAIADINGDIPIKGGDIEQAWAYEKVRGNISPTVVRGRVPMSDNEVMLGTKTASDLGLHLGDVLHVPRPKGEPVAFRVVGYTLFPTVETDNFTRGIVVTRRAFAQLQLPDAYKNVVVRWKPGTDVAKEAARITSERDFDGTLAAPTADVKNLDAVRNYPRWLASFLVVLGILATTHTLVVSARRRRHEMGVLRAIGFSRRQLARAVWTHGLTMGAIAVVIGVPLGIAAGRWVWVTHASHIGLSTSVYAPVAIVLAVAVGTVLLTWAIAVVAGRRAIRARLTTALRVE